MPRSAFLRRDGGEEVWFRFLVGGGGVGFFLGGGVLGVKALDRSGARSSGPSLSSSPRPRGLPSPLHSDRRRVVPCPPVASSCPPRTETGSGAAGVGGLAAGAPPRAQEDPSGRRDRASAAGPRARPGQQSPGGSGWTPGPARHSVPANPAQEPRLAETRLSCLRGWRFPLVSSGLLGVSLNLWADQACLALAPLPVSCS